MAFPKKVSREARSRRNRGYKPTKHPYGFDRWWFPTICGLVDADGNECPNKTSSYGLCDEHREQRHREQGLIPTEPEESP